MARSACHSNTSLRLAPYPLRALTHASYRLLPGEAAGRVADQGPRREFWALKPQQPLAAPPTLPTLPLDFFILQLSHTSVSIAPADYSSWHDVRTELMSEAKGGFKARVEAELAAAGGENLDELKAAFQQVRKRATKNTKPGPNPQAWP